MALISSNSYRVREETVEGQALYYDGKRATSVSVHVKVTDSFVQIRDKDLNIVWEKSCVCFEQYRSYGVILNSQKGAKLQIEDPAFLEALRCMSPSLFPKERSYLYSVWGGIFIIFIFVGITAVSYRGVLFDGLVKYCPTWVEKRLGDLTVSIIASEDKKIEEVRIQKPLEKIVKTLSPLLSIESPVQVYVCASSDVNAMATAGKKIVVLTGFLQKSKSQEEVVGVLAHELGHIQHNHVMRSLVRTMGVGTFLWFLGGPQSDYSAFAFNMVQLKHTRDFERQADKAAVQALHELGVNLDGLIDFFERVSEKLRTREFKVQNYFETHPPTHDRIEYFKENLREMDSFQILSEKEWNDLKQAVDEWSDEEEDDIDYEGKGDVDPRKDDPTEDDPTEDDPAEDDFTKDDDAIDSQSIDKTHKGGKNIREV